MMITLGNNKAMKTFQQPTMFESFSEIEHNRIDCLSNEGQLVEISNIQSDGNLKQSSQTTLKNAQMTGNQKINFRSGSRVKMRTTLISISPPSSPTNQLTDASCSINSDTIIQEEPKNNTRNYSRNSSSNTNHQTAIINYGTPVRKDQNQINKKKIIRCESVDSINHMNGYSSVSSCSTVINKPTVQKINWNVCQNNCNNKLVKFRFEDVVQQCKQNNKSLRPFNSNENKSLSNNFISGINKSKTVDNISKFMQPQQQHQTCPQYRQEMQQKLTAIQQIRENKSKENVGNSTNNAQISMSNQSISVDQDSNDTKQPHLNSNRNVRTTNNVNTGYALPQLTTQPLIAIRRILLLYENLQYKETAQFITRLQNACFQLILRDLPVGLFIEQMPQSLIVLEALYAKLYASLQELDCLYSNGALIVSSAQLAALPELNSNQTVNHTIGRNLLKLLQPESVTMHLVKMFALKSHAHHSIYDCTSSSSANHNHHSSISNGVFSLMQEKFDNNHPMMITMRKLLKTILTIQPPISKQLAARKRAIDNAIDALGHHGLVSTGNSLTNANTGSISSSASSSSSSSTGSSTSNPRSSTSPVSGCTSSLDGNSVLMMSLHEALKLEFDYVIQQYKHAVQKLEEAMNSANTGNNGKQLTQMKFTLRNLSKLPAPSSASHQRQLSLRSDEIQLRLVRNKSLLNSLEQYVLNQHSVQILMGILEQRINYDKETLFQFTQLRKEFNYCCTLSQQLASSFGNGAAAHGHTTREPNPTMCVHNGEMNCCIDANAIVAPVLMRFSFGCGQVLRVFEDISAEMLTESDLANSKKNVEKVIVENNLNNPADIQPIKQENHKTKLEEEAKNHEESFEPSKVNQIDQVFHPNSKTTVNNSEAKNYNKDDMIDEQLINKRKHTEQLENEETQQSSSDISGYHSDENPDYPLNGSQSEKQNSGCLDGKRIDSQSSNFYSRSSSSPLSFASYSPSCLSDLRDDDLNKKSIASNLVEITSSQHHDLSNVETPISYLDNEQNETCWTPQQSRYTDNELIMLKRELIRSKQTIFELQEREQQLLIKFKQKQPVSPPQDLLTDSTTSIPKFMPDVTLTPIPFSPQQSPEKRSRPCALIRRFGDLYSQARVDTLDSLDMIEQLKGADELKSKLLFSVVVLSFRSIQKTITDIKQRICALLQIYDCNQPNQSAIKQLEIAINTYFKANLDTFDTTKNLEEVSNQIWTTLYDYPCLKDSSGLNNYINDCVKLAWALSVQSPAYLIKFDIKSFDPDYHVRFHISDSTNSHISSYLWPILIEEGETGVCVHKGVVIT